MKVVSVGIDLYHVGLTTDHVSPELFGILIIIIHYFIYCQHV